MMTMLEKEMSGDAGMIKQVKESVEKRMQESF